MTSYGQFSAARMSRIERRTLCVAKAPCQVPPERHLVASRTASSAMRRCRKVPAVFTQP